MPKKVRAGKTNIRERKTFASRLGGTKSRAALALAVSLWIATGGLASAQETTITADHNGNVYGNNDGAYWDTYTDGSNDNTVNMTGGNVQLGGSNVTVLGAYVTTGDASGNQVTVRGGSIINGSELAGAAAYDTTARHDLNNNTVTVTGSANIAADIDGAVTNNGTADSNHVIITGGTVNKGNGTGHIYGGRSDGSGDAKNNTVKISGGTVTARLIVGGFIESGNPNGNATGNEVTVSVDVTGAVYGCYTAGGTGDATGNKVTLDGAKVTGDVYGGYRSRSTGKTTENKVTLTGATVTGDVYGGYRWNGTGDVTNNTVTLNGATVTGNVYGGYGYYTMSGTVDVTNNTVTLNGAKVTGNVYGGYATSGYGAVTGNFVTGNTLNLSGVNEAQSIANFDTVNIKSAVWGTPALTLTGNIGTVNNINTDGIVFSGIDALPATGENTVLIKNKMTGYTGNITSGKFKVGTTLEGEGTASVSGDDLIYTVDTDSTAAQEQTHNTVMGAEVGMAALSVGNDFIGAATEGLALASNVGADGISSFAKMGGGTMRQETGSHVDTHTWNAILALGHQNKKERGTFEYGAFFEYGSGNYTTHNGNERGDGSARYTGGGLLAKYTAKSGMYVEGSLRAGTVHDDARNVLRDAFGNPYSYETNANYFGGHVGVGKEITLNNGNVVDVYGKYFCNRRNGVDFNAGGQYNLDAVTSSVIRVGARYTVKSSKWNFYAGAAYEHELDGKANGTADGVAIRGADTSGASFRGELGATVTPDKNVPVTLDFNLTGFAGKKQGLSGGVSVSLMF